MSNVRDKEETDGDSTLSDWKYVLTWGLGTSCSDPELEMCGSRPVPQLEL